MWCVVVVFVEEFAYLGRCFVRVGCCVSKFAVYFENITGVVMVRGEEEEVVSIEYSSL